MAKHLNLLIGESALDAVLVPAETVITKILQVRAIIERLLWGHEEGVGFSVIAKVSKLKGEKIVLTTVSTYRVNSWSEVTSVTVGMVSGRGGDTIMAPFAARFSALRVAAFALVACCQFRLREAFP